VALINTRWTALGSPWPASGHFKQAGDLIVERDRRAGGVVKGNAADSGSAVVSGLNSLPPNIVGQLVLASLHQQRLGIGGQ